MATVQTYEVFVAAASLFLSGTICGVSMLAVPVALETAKADAGLLQQWKSIYFNGHIKGPAIATIVGAVMVFIAVLKAQEGDDPTTSATGAALAVGIVPYTWTVMNGVNKTLHSSAASAGSYETDVRKLVVRWSRMNAVRGALPLAGGLVSLWGVLGKRS